MDRCRGGYKFSTLVRYRALFIFRFSDSLTFSRVEDTGIDIAQERGIAGGLDTGGMVTRSTKREGAIIAWELSFSLELFRCCPIIDRNVLSNYGSFSLRVPWLSLCLRSAITWGWVSAFSFLECSR